MTKICDGVEDCPPSSLTRFFSKFWDTGKSEEDKTLCKINEDEDYKTSCNNLDKNCNKFKAIDYDDNGDPTCDKVLCYQCRKGYTLNDDRTCVDIDECRADYFKSYHHPCSHGCTNTNGGLFVIVPLVMSSPEMTKPVNL